MALLHKILLQAHVLAGAAALVLFWFPAFARKGGRLHRRAGNWYVISMYAVSVSAFVMAILVFSDPLAVRLPGQDIEPARAERIIANSRMFSLFLFMLSILVIASVRHGTLVLKAGADRSALRHPAHIFLMASLGIVSLIVGALGIANGQALLIIFSALGIVGSINMLRYSTKATLTPREWWIEHLGNLIGSGIGAYTAFFAFGGARFFGDILTGNLMLIPWVLPSIIGTIFSIALTRKYRAHFGSMTKPRTGT